MDHEEYKRKALEPIVSYIESVMASYSKEELEARIKKALPEKENEDERIRKAISAAICGTTAETVLEANGVKLVDALSYLEKQKEQESTNSEKPKEWSEEDEAMLESIIKDYDYLCKIWLQDYEKRLGVADLAARRDTRKQISWLKSLRPQPHWKPSEEQMDILDKVYRYLWADRNATADMQDGLGDFIDDLKQLM